jgi:membrane protein YqaA with SNARE-associated domain
MLRRLYDRLMALAASRKAPLWLALVSFAESSFFPVPPDLMLAPMVLAKPERAWLNAAICTAASVVGGMLGYAIGFFAAPLAGKLLTALGQAHALAGFQDLYAHVGLWVILLKGLTPIPFKLVTIASGLAHFNFGVFVAACIVTRGARFFLVTALLKAYGPPIQTFVEKRLTLVTTAIALLAIGGVVLLKFIEH